MPPAVVAPPTPPEIDEKKRRLRAEMIERRKRFADVEAGRKLVKSVAGLGPFRPGAAIDVLPVLSWFTRRGHPTALPAVAGRRLPLVFRSWSPGEPLDEGAFGIPFPAAGAADLIPEILLVPLLAFDRRGHRLGYGGGFYDRTLADLRAKGPILAIGVGYAFQEVDEVPSGAYDQRIDMIATETGGERLA